jgi:hypothetical protein
MAQLSFINTLRYYTVMIWCSYYMDKRITNDEFKYFGVTCIIYCSACIHQHIYLAKIYSINIIKTCCQGKYFNIMIEMATGPFTVTSILHNSLEKVLCRALIRYIIYIL